MTSTQPQSSSSSKQSPAGSQDSKKESQSSSSHLARVRENQRRSRARRKGYLQELEERFRRCEQLGVEASAEMQAAARKVLEENKRLRAFLRSKGFDEAELDRYAVANAEELAHHPPGPPTHAVASLENLMGQRKPCGQASDRSASSDRQSAASAPTPPTVSTLPPMPLARTPSIASSTSSVIPQQRDPMRSHQLPPLTHPSMHTNPQYPPLSSMPPASHPPQQHHSGSSMQPIHRAISAPTPWDNFYLSNSSSGGAAARPRHPNSNEYGSSANAHASWTGPGGISQAPSHHYFADGSGVEDLLPPELEAHFLSGIHSSQAEEYDASHDGKREWQ